jgi:hypothetical protein
VGLTLWYLARRHLARRLATTVALALLVALTSGSVMALAAGATRTEDALPRFVERTRPSGDAVVYAQVDEAVPFHADDQSALMALLDDIPVVTEARRATYVIADGVSEDGLRQRLLGAVPIDGHRELVFGSPLLVEGDWPDAGDPLGLAIDEELAARAGLQTGDTYRIAPFTSDQFGPAGEGADVEPAGPGADLRVAAIYRYPDDLQAIDLDQEGIYVDRSSLELTPAYWETFGPDLARYNVGAVVALTAGASIQDLTSALRERIPDRFVVEPGVFAGGGGDAIGGIRRAVELQAHGMRIVAAVTGVTGAALLWMLLGRQAASDRRRDEVLAGLGLGRRARAVMAALEGAAIGVVGAAMGVLLAVLSSGWMPFGLARRAELEPGLDIDAPVLATGTLVAVAVVAAAMAAAAHPGRSRKPRQVTTSRLSRSLAAAGALGPAPEVGLRFALQREPDARSLTVRTAMSGIAVSAAVVIAVAVAGASLALVRDEPERRGAYGDAVVGNLGSPDAAEAAGAVLDANPDVSGYRGESTSFLTFGEEVVFVSAYFDGPGDLAPVIIDGRLPVADDEIALGAVVMNRLGVAIGDTVEVTYSGAPVTLDVVGAALVDDVNGAVGGPGKAGVIAEPALRLLDPARDAITAPTRYVVELVDGVDRAAALDRLRTEFPRAVVTPRLPDDLRNIERLGGLAVLLGVLVCVLGAGAAFIALSGAVRRRRRELAILRTFGFLRRQAALVIAAQATTFAAVGLLLGLPLGLIAGRAIWTGVAERVGIEPVPVVPLGVLAAVVVVTVVVLNAVAAVPARRAARLRPAEILRAE